ncbi:inositol monophosphatase family protein [Actinomadura sp. 9N407]|uniref:inositol monophosphatase family protein n=1 Tax=Actinomadura sp. 9N407 TaxID=3375154 RepID=UPI0037B34DAE
MNDVSIDVPASRELAGIAERAARATGDRLRKAFRSRPEVALKRDFHDPVTEHDRAAEETIREILERECPGSAVIGEEGGLRGGADGALRWYVDPIDGTANFAAGLPFFCTSIGAVVGDRVVAGVVYDPVRDDLFTATLDGAACNGEPLGSTGAAGDRTAVLVTGYPNARELRRSGDRALRRYATFVESFATVRRPGSAALSLAHVAGGWADAAYGTSVNAWDVAAALLLVRQAGGTYLPLGGEPGGQDWDAPGYVACVGGFDLAGSVLAEAAGLPAVGSET